jgi:hypothetical protein
MLPNSPPPPPSLDGLAAFSGLVQLHAHMNQLTSLSHLTTAPFLLTVLASKNLISSLSFEDIVPLQLRHLDLSNNRLSNVSALAALPSLTSLNLSANQITAISGFQSLTNLCTLKVANNSLIRLGQAAFASSLQALDAHGNGLADARDVVLCLYNLKNLHSLTITQNPVEKVANFQVDVVAAAPSLKELNYLVIKQGFREELQLAAVSGIVEDASQKLKLGYLRAVEREQQRLLQCINSTKLKETFYEKAFDGYKKKLEAEFGAAIHRVQGLSSAAVASGDYDTVRVAQEAAAVMQSFAHSSNATGDFGRAIASDVFAHSSNVSTDAVLVAPPPLRLRSFDASKEATIFELSSSDVADDDGADFFPEAEFSTSLQSSASSQTSSEIKAASSTSASSPRLSTLPSLAPSSPANPITSGTAIPPSSSITASTAPVAAAPVAAVAQRPPPRPRPLSPKPSSVKAIRSQDFTTSPNPFLTPAVSATPLLQQLPQNSTTHALEQSAAPASKSCVLM